MKRLAVLELWLTLTVSRDTPAQPYTGKTVRQALYKLAEETRVEELAALLEPGGRKPYSTTPLLASGKPLIKYRPGPPLTLYAGKPYLFRLSLVTDRPALAELLVSLPARIEVYSTPALVSLQSINFYTEDTLRLGIRPAAKVKLEFLTPTQLQLPKLNKRSKKPRYTQIPEPRLILHSLRELWNLYAADKILTSPWRANYALTPTFLDVQTRSTIYDSSRKITGFTGTITYRVDTRGKKVLSMLDRLLALASLIGVGKSRGIGLGYTRVTLLDNHPRRIAERASRRGRRVLAAPNTG